MAARLTPTSSRRVPPLFALVLALAAAPRGTDAGAIVEASFASEPRKATTTNARGDPAVPRPGSAGAEKVDVSAGTASQSGPDGHADAIARAAPTATTHTSANDDTHIAPGSNTTRRSTWWRPVGCGSSASCQNSTLTSLRARFGSWDTFSPTVARVYNGTSDLDLAPLAPDVVAAISAAKAIGYRVVPMLEIDCGKVVGNANSSADYAPAIAALVALASKHGFDGYTCDMICGDLERTKNTTTRRFVDFVDTLLAGLGRASGVGPDPEVNWFAHGYYHPQAALPNNARACFSEDTYRCARIDWTLEGVRGWVGALRAQAGIGLEPGPGVRFLAPQLGELFGTLLKLGVTSVGTWGTFESNPYKEEWASAMRMYLAGNASALAVAAAAAR